MGVNPKRGLGRSYRPLLESDIHRAQMATKSAMEAARYLNVDYKTYKKYATMYGLHEQHINQAGRGLKRKRKSGAFGLDEILAGKHPNYDMTRLKERLIRAGYIEESCCLCGFEKKREIDNRAPLILHCKDGNNHNLKLENLELRCYNCTMLTTGRVSAKHIMDVSTYDKDVLDTGITMDEIHRIQDELMGE
jgi:hypothetical protein